MNNINNLLSIPYYDDSKEADAPFFKISTSSH